MLTIETYFGPGLLHSVPTEIVALTKRQVLVIEVWAGPECTCPHRCEEHGGECALRRTIDHEL